MTKVEQFYNKNQFLLRGEDGITFQSYGSTIANINNDGKLKLFCDWDYSHTTLKHLYLFLNDFDCLLNETGRKLVDELQYNNNKRKTIQKYIDQKLIKCEF